MNSKDKVLKGGVQMVDGTKAGFDDTELPNGYIHLIRTDGDRQEGYVMLNGKRYGKMPESIDCGTF